MQYVCIHAMVVELCVIKWDNKIKVFVSGFLSLNEVTELSEHLLQQTSEGFCLRVICLTLLWLRTCTSSHFQPGPSLHGKYYHTF